MPRQGHGIAAPHEKIGDVRPEELPAQGLLYLPNPYVVPGGRFNEMYGWDSYFIVLGLEADHREALAKGMVDNFFFEIEHYGGVLNANRTYYLTRSQPPFLTSMIRAVYEDPASFPATRGGSRRGPRVARARLRAGARRTTPPGRGPSIKRNDTGLARYFDYGTGPVPEMADNDTYYIDVHSLAGCSIRTRAAKASWSKAPNIPMRPRRRGSSRPAATSMRA